MVLAEPCFYYLSDSCIQSIPGVAPPLPGGGVPNKFTNTKHKTHGVRRKRLLLWPLPPTLLPRLVVRDGQMALLPLRGVIARNIEEMGSARLYFGYISGLGYHSAQCPFLLSSLCL